MIKKKKFKALYIEDFSRYLSDILLRYGGKNYLFKDTNNYL